MNAELFAANAAAHWMQAALLVTAALTTLWLLSPAKPSFRLAVLQLILATTFLLPILQPRTAPVLPVLTRAVSTTVTIEGVAVPLSSHRAYLTRADMAQLLAGTILAGIALRLLWLLLGGLRLRRFSQRAFESAAPAAAAELEAELGVTPRYIVQPANCGPWTFGIFRPTIALPSTFGGLASPVQRSVLCHELLHVQRRDVVAAFAEELMVTALWFHPWAWLLRARIRVAREQAVDARAVTMLGSRSDYVKCLVDMSGHDLAPHLSQSAAGMLRPRELRARIDALLEGTHMSSRRAAVGAALLLSVMAGTGLLAAGIFPLRVGGNLETVVHAPGQHVNLDRVFSRAQSPVPASGARRQISMTPAEYPREALARGIRGQVTVDITVSPAGDVTTASVVGGPSELRDAGFAIAMGLKYEAGPSTTAGRVGVQFEIDRASWGVRVVEMRSSGAVSSQAPTDADWTAALRIGGDMRPPKKIKNVDPDYPAVARAARVQGVVMLEARVDEAGNVSDTRALRSIPLLDQAAIAAVKQWKYEPPLLNGAPTAVVLTVTVNFTLRDLIDIRLMLPGGELASISMLASGMTVVTPHGNFQLRALRDRNARAAVISVLQEDGTTLLGDVYAEEGGPVVQLPTTPPVGLQLVSLR